MELLRASLSQVTIPEAVGFGVWAAVMIAVPILRWVYGTGAERVGISLGVIAQVSLVLLVLSEHLPPGRVLLTAAAVPFLGWLAEFVGSRTGFPFGDYEYTDVLKPQIGRVPVIIPLAWLMMMPSAWTVAALITGGENRLITALVAGAAFTAWDFFLDPQMVNWNFWQWNRKGGYFGIPWVNFLGWFLVSSAISALLIPEGAQQMRVLYLVFILTWLLQGIGEFFFWKLRGPAVAGALAMGLFILLPLL
ncbi:MAG: carotenoid biosynthesis protein [Alkalispirochaetaceae bacterium]